MIPKNKILVRNKLHTAVKYGPEPVSCLAYELSMMPGDLPQGKLNSELSS